MNEKGLIYAFILDGTGGGRPLGWEDIKKWNSSQGVIWLHFDYSAEETREWILKDSTLDDISAEALLTEETRPRTTHIGDAALLALRGVNLNPGSDPEDMVSIRVWIDQDRIISTRKRKLLSAADIASSLRNQNGPRTSGEFIIDLTDRLTSRMEGAIESIEDRVAQMEEDVLVSGSHSLRSELSDIRREAIMLRRYLAPQREALTKLCTEKASWLGETDRMRLREITDRLIRYVEDLDSVRDRVSVIQEELVNRLSEQMNTRMYVLSLVAAIFLPLGFLTGLLGINVGGIPGTENKLAFLIVILILLIVFILQVMLFKKKHWI